MFVPHKKQVWISTGCYRGSFTGLYVDDVRTAQETRHITVCYGDSFTFYTMYMMFVPHSKHVISRSVTGIALIFIRMYMMFVPHRKHMYIPPRPITWIALLFYM
jgi:hypothetical protein